MKSPLEHLRELSKKRKAMQESAESVAKRMKLAAEAAAKATSEPPGQTE